MKKDKKLLNISDLKVGMITANDIIAENRLLLAKGLPITEQMLIKLRNTYLYNKIEIFNEEIHNNDNASANNMKSIEHIETNFIELTLNIQNIFNNMEKLQSSNIEEVRSFASRIQEELDSTSLVIKNIVHRGSGKDSIYRHCVNVAALSTLLGKWIGLNNQELNLLTYSAVLHDFGKITISRDILDKPSILTQKEFDTIKHHPIVAYNYLKRIKFLHESVGLGVLMHHEKADGSGYPLGLKGDKIHRYAKIIAISDMFDAINSDRLHKKSRRPFEALALIQEESLNKLDYEYCNIFINRIICYYIGESVLLNDGRLCKIVQIDVNNIERPLLLNDNDFIDLKKQNNLHVEKFVF